MRPLRVLHVNKLYAPVVGGVEGVVQVLAEEAARSPDLEAEVLVCQPRGAPRVDVVNGVRVTRVGSLGTWLSMPVAPSFPLALRRMRRAFDVVHVHQPFPLPIFAGWPEDPDGPRVVLHYHCDISRRVQTAILGALRPWTRRMFRRADRIIVTSENLLRHAVGLRGFHEKCTVIPLPATLPRGDRAPIPRATRQGFGVAEDEPVVLAVGRLVPYKGFEYLIDAMRQVQARLLLAGDGRLRPALERRVADLGLGDRVTLLGHVDGARLDAAYRLADVFVLPSVDKAEAFGLVQLEAMAHGCPVVNTDLPTGVPSVSLHGQTGFTVPPRDAQALADAMNRLLRDPALRRTFGANARLRVARFDRKTVGRAVRDLYFEVCAERAGADAPAPLRKIA